MRSNKIWPTSHAHLSPRLVWWLLPEARPRLRYIVTRILLTRTKRHFDDLDFCCQFCNFPLHYCFCFDSTQVIMINMQGILIWITNVHLWKFVTDFWQTYWNKFAKSLEMTMFRSLPYAMYIINYAICYATHWLLYQLCQKF